MGHQFGQSKVKNLQPSVRRDAKISRLQIAMHYSLLMRRRQPRSQLHSKPHHLQHGERPLGDLYVKSDARNVFGDQELGAVMATEFMHGRDVGMVQACERQRLFAKSLVGGLVLRSEE